MKRLLLVISTLVLSVCLHAQLLTLTPNFPVEDDPSQNLVIVVDANFGNKALLNYNPNDVYVHLGAVTNLTNGGWKQPDKFAWASTVPAAKAVSLGNNKWQFTISGSLKSYFNIPAGETILRIGILFRNGAGSIVQRNADGSDMYIPLYSSGLAVRILEPFSQPLLNPLPENQNLAIGTHSFKVAVNKPSTVTIDPGTGTTQTMAVTNEHTFSVNFTTAGFYQVKVTAATGAETATSQLNFTVGSISSPVVDLPAGLRDGINYEAGNTAATLVFHAPGKNIVTVIGDFNNWTESSNYVLNKTSDGKKFWIRLTGLMPGVEYAYQYKVDNKLKIADPYAQKILDPNSDSWIPSSTFPNLKPYPTGKTTDIVSVLQTAPPAYNWSVTNFNRPDKRGLVIYELLVRDFIAAHDWKTLTDTLSYFKRLGINAIQLMPINEFENNESWGYNPSFYFAPDKYYGPANDLKRFIDSCHKNGIAVIMDIALNHAFGQSPMVQLYFENGRPAANNPWFNPVAKHAYNVGYDFNHESPDTKRFVGRVVEHWLQEYKIDGFRFDLSKGFTQKQTCDNNGNACNEGAMAAYDASRVAIWKAYHDTVQNKSANAYTILEHFAVDQEDRELADYGMLLWGNLNYNYRQAAKGVTTNDGNFQGGIHSVRGWSKPHLITYMESHDEERIVHTNLNEGLASGSYNIKDTATALKRMELASAFFLTIPGPKMIWQFGELGYPYSINTCANGTTIDNSCRLANKPIRWDYQADSRRVQVYNTYSSLLKLRSHPLYKELFLSGTIEQSLSGAFKWLKVSSGDTSKLVVVGNFGLTTTMGSVTFPDNGIWYDYLGNTTFPVGNNTQNITLQPGEYKVFISRNASNLTTTPVVTIPSSGSLLEAKVYPNPVKGKFVVELYVPQSGNTRVELLNISGQQVATLKQQFFQKGKHQLEFNKSNISAPSGNYYIKISTGSGAQKTLQVTLQ